MIVFLFLVLSSGVSAYKSIYTGQECNACIANNQTWAAVCNSKYSQRISYCCDENDMKNSVACLYAPLCSWNITANDTYTNSSMRGQACPYDKLSCGRDSNEIMLSMNETQTLEVGRYFDNADVCHYSFGAWD